VGKFAGDEDFNRTFSMDMPTAARSYPMEDETKKISSTAIRIDGVVPTSQLSE